MKRAPKRAGRRRRARSEVLDRRIGELAVALLCSWFFVLALGACATSKSSRCKQLCQRQIECIETLARKDIRIDENECTTVCGDLERASEGKERVDQLAACLETAGDDCQAVLECQ